MITILQVFSEVLCHDIVCEEISNGQWPSFHNKSLKTCDMRTSTIIDESNVKISTFDDTVHGLTFYSNIKILFLPVEVSKKFPNLIAFSADETSIRDLSKENFRGLQNLQSLSLVNNKIERIYSDTFKDLKSLEILWLGKNKCL